MPVLTWLWTQLCSGLLKGGKGREPQVLGLLRMDLKLFSIYFWIFYKLKNMIYSIFFFNLGCLNIILDKLVNYNYHDTLNIIFMP